MAYNSVSRLPRYKLWLFHFGGLNGRIWKPPKNNRNLLLNNYDKNEAK